LCHCCVQLGTWESDEMREQQKEEGDHGTTQHSAAQRSAAIASLQLSLSLSLSLSFLSLSLICPVTTANANKVSRPEGKERQAIQHDHAARSPLRSNSATLPSLSFHCIWILPDHQHFRFFLVLDTRSPASSKTERCMPFSFWTLLPS